VVNTGEELAKVREQEPHYSEADCCPENEVVLIGQDGKQALGFAGRDAAHGD
jgi:hypothetical protein